MVRIVNTEETEQGLMLQYYETSQNWVQKEVHRSFNPLYCVAHASFW